VNKKEQKSGKSEERNEEQENAGARSGKKEAAGVA
jgi:hypothetical protein